MHQRVILMLLAILVMPPVLAQASIEDTCTTIANTCLAAGFVKTDSPDKGLWHDCMRPILLNQTVSGVTVDAANVKACRDDKIKELQTELNELQNANNTN